MPNPKSWFRVHNDILNNKKLKMISSDAYRLFFELLALRNLGQIHEGKPITIDELSKLLGRDRRKVSRTFTELRAEVLVKSDGTPSRWAKRQFLEAESTPRVRKFRAKDKPVTVTPLRAEQSRADKNKTRAPNRKANEAAVLVCAAFNNRLGTNRTPSKSLIGLCNGLVKDGHSPEDIGKVAKFRCREDWVDTTHVPESLVRKTKFESYLQAADEAPENQPQIEAPYNEDFFKEN